MTTNLNALLNELLAAIPRPMNGLDEKYIMYNKRIDRISAYLLLNSFATNILLAYVADNYQQIILMLLCTMNLGHLGTLLISGLKMRDHYYTTARAMDGLNNIISESDIITRNTNSLVMLKQEITYEKLKLEVFRCKALLMIRIALGLILASSRHLIILIQIEELDLYYNLFLFIEGLMVLTLELREKLFFGAKK